MADVGAYACLHGLAFLGIVGCFMIAGRRGVRERD